MIACDEDNPLLYLDGDLSGRENYEAHLRDCPACRGQLAAARQLNELIKSWPREEVPPHLAEQIRQQLQPRSPAAWRLWLAAAAAVLLCLGLWRLRPQQPPQQPMARVAPGPVAHPVVTPVVAESPVSRPIAIQDRVLSTTGQANVIPLAGQVLTLGPHSQVQVEPAGGGKYLLRLTAGEVRVQEHGEVIAVSTAQLRVDPLGTDYLVRLGVGRTRVEVYTGRVKITSRLTPRPVELVAGGSLELPARSQPAKTRPQPPASATPSLPEAAYPIHTPSPTVAAPFEPPPGEFPVEEPQRQVEPPPEPFQRFPQERRDRRPQRPPVYDRRPGPLEQPGGLEQRRRNLERQRRRLNQSRRRF